MDYIKNEINDQIAVLTINRPKELNALDYKVLKELDEAIDSLDCQTIRCLVIQGEGNRAFVAGADISEMVNMTRDDAKTFSEYGNNIFFKISNLSIPTIALIQGYALGGGCELALACDIRVASETAVIGQPETGLGIIPGFGGTQRLARIVGLSKAKEMIFTGKSVKAEEALRIGLVDHLFFESEAMEKTIEIARSIALNAPIAIRNAKISINKGIELDIEQALHIETECFSKTFETDDQREGMTAFLEKRKHNPFMNQ